MRIAWITSLLLLALSFHQAQAAIKLDDLYQARVPVTAQTNTERMNGLRQALIETLVKVSGDSRVLDHDSVKQALNDVNTYVVQFGYQQSEDDLSLWVQFDQQQIERLIQQAGSGVWGALRPQLLFWIAVENESFERALISAADTSEFTQRWRAEARRRGLPSQLPLLDLNDLMSVSARDVWSGFDEQINFASSRYDHDGVVAARAYRSDLSLTRFPWTLDWRLKLGTNIWQGQLEAMEYAELGQLLVTDIGERLAAHYRIAANSETASVLTIQVLQMQQLTQIIKAEQLLAALPSVNRVKLRHYGQHTAEFALSIQTEASQIMQAIEILREFELIADPQPQRNWYDTPTEPQQPRFRWSQP